jgi:flagellar basal-body rod protein FlgG
MSDFGVIANGLTTTQALLTTDAANLANRATDGYGTLWLDPTNVASSVARPADTVLDGTTIGPGLTRGNGSTVGPDAITWSTDHQATGVSTNLALTGSGFFVVTPPGGGVAYTRNGAFTANAAGQLALPDGAVLAGIRPAPPGSTMQVAADGQVTAETPQGVVTRLGTVPVVTFANPGGLAPQAGTLYTGTGDSGPAQAIPAAAAGLVPGSVNTSGVSLSQAMAAMLADETAYGSDADALHTLATVTQTADTLHI